MDDRGVLVDLVDARPMTMGERRQNKVQGKEVDQRFERDGGRKRKGSTLTTWSCARKFHPTESSYQLLQVHSVQCCPRGLRRKQIEH